MAQANDLSTLNGNFKEVYAGKIEDLIPEAVKLTKKVNFIESSKELGNKYHQPVILANEHGFTYGDTGEAYALNAASAGQVKDAEVTGFEIILRSQLSYAAASRAAGGRNAFVDSTQLLVKNMRRSVARQLEIQLMYGAASIGVVSGAPSANVITITDRDWAAGIWSGSEGMRINAFDAISGGTRQDTAAAGFMVVVAVDNEAKTITVDDDTGVADTDFLFMFGAYAKEMIGLHAIMTNTGSLFGIDASLFNLWKGNTFSANSGPLSFNIVTKAVALAVAKGLDGDICLLVSNVAWSNLLQDQAALREFDQSYNVSDNKEGSKAITFYSQNGMIEIIPSIYVKEGYAYLMDPKDFVRPGSTDVTFNRPGQAESFFMDLENNAGYELRSYTDQALFCHSPGRQVVITDIVNS